MTAGFRSPVTEEQKALCIEYLRKGYSQRDSAVMAGFSEHSFYVIRDKDYEFGMAASKALIEYKSQRVKRIEEDPSWQSDAWLLERKFKEEFGRETVVQVEGLDDKLTEIADAIMQSDTDSEEVPD